MHGAEAGVDGDAGEVLVGRQHHPGVAGRVVLVLLVPILGQEARVLVPGAVVIFLEDVQLLGVVVGVHALLEPLAAVLVVLVVEGDVLGKLHDPLDGVNLVLHHDLHLNCHLAHHRQTVDFLDENIAILVIALSRGEIISRARDMELTGNIETRYN